MLIDSVTIPGTGYRRIRNPKTTEDTLESSIGEVTGHVVLAKYIVFITDLNKVFCYPAKFPMLVQDMPKPIELTTFYTATPTQPLKIRDIQGAFTRFAIFTHDGCVMTASDDLLEAFQNVDRTPSNGKTQTLPTPALFPSLQTKTITSLAFGDHHFLALHGNGTVTAYGQELNRCGALGLGTHTTFASQLRGVIVDGTSRFVNRLPEKEGRTVWFEPLMATWLEDMQHQSSATDESRERSALLHGGHEDSRRAYADYFENEGANWEGSVTKEGEMGSYFVLKVAAGGWSSAALVLVDEDKAEKVREAHTVRSSSYRLPPSPAPSAQSTESYESIESPGEQLSSAIHSIYEWVCKLGRSFLGLTARDARREVESRGQACEPDGNGVEYVWSKKPFPRLRLPDGTAMPGQIPLTE